MPAMTNVNTPRIMSLKVSEVTLLNPLIRVFHLRSQDSRYLPGFSPGAHIKVQVHLPDGRVDWRHYSLIQLDTAHQVEDGVPEYLIAVRREDGGRGGSLWLHDKVKSGDVLQVEEPRNDFPMHASEGKVVLLAGGIGVTPLLSMATYCRAIGQPVRMHYAGRSRETMAFIPDIQSLLQNDLHLHIDQEAGTTLDVVKVFDECGNDDHLYVCGPAVLLDAVLAQANARNWSVSRLHFELFAPKQTASSNKLFEVVLSSSGRRLTIKPEQSILDVLIDSGCDPMFDCKRGECGVCAVGVISGEIDHRDYVLTQREKDAGNVIHTCVSRCTSSTLVLDL